MLGEIDIITIVKVALDKVSYFADKLYSYKLDKDMTCQVGCRVIVPFGMGNAKRQGIVFEILKEDSCNEDLKSVYAVVDASPVVNEHEFGIIKWIKNRYFCTYFDAVHLVLPSGINWKPSDIRYKITSCDNNIKISKKEIEFLESLKNLNKESISLKDIAEIKFKNYKKLIRSLVSKGILEEVLNYDKQIKSREISLISLDGKFSDWEGLRSESQRKVCEFLSKNPLCTIKEISYKTGVSSGVVNNLIKKGYLIKKKSVSVSDFETCEDLSVKMPQKIVFNDEQEKVLKKLIKNYNSKEFSIGLINGVTGSGKTAVLMGLIDYVINLKKSVIFMVPEIALTSQFVSMFKARYKDYVAVIHSGLTPAKRYDVWKKIKNGDAKVIIGTRSAVFAPAQNLGLVIIDEEHEFTYKSESSPRFSTKEVAIYRCHQLGAKLVLSSATPSLESYYQAKCKKYNLYELNSRYGNAKLPNVEIVDMNEYNVNDIISPYLMAELKNNIEKHKQSVLLINRRGYNTFAKCSKCGHVFECPNCSVSLNFHKSSGRFMCHCCGYSCSDLKKCPECKSERIIYLGAGTQKIEDVLLKSLPGAKILRLDSDVKNCKGSINSEIKDFEAGKYDILIGTQMVSKGFNFPNVTLVGVISADQSLYDGEFRSGEKTFSLLTQVVGRAGRMNGDGKAIIQTYAPENEVIQMAANQDYKAFYESEIKIRKVMLNPPFSDICIIVFRGVNENLVYNSAKYTFDVLKKLATNSYPDVPLRIYSPTEAKIKKVANNYRYKIVIKCRNNQKFRDFLSNALEEYSSSSFSGRVATYVDFNPDMIL